MESIDLEMNDVFGEDMDEDDDIGALGALPDLTQNTQNEDNEDADNEEVNKRLKALSKGAAKKVVRKPQPKLDADRLTGERGIPILQKLGEKMKLKGMNHEAEDLKQIMRHMEHWAHRLFPKMPFDEVVERVDKLGSKGPVKTCIKKIRLDIPILTEEFVGSDNEDDDVKRNGEDDMEQGESKAESMWDELIEEEAEIRAIEVGKQSQSVRKQIEGGQGESRNPDSTSQDLPGTSKTKNQGNPGALTPEQLERMERNKQLALERKMKKSGLSSPALNKSQISTSPVYTATPLRVAQLTQSELSQTPESSTEKSKENQSSEVGSEPSQNILIEQKQEDAQRWLTQTDSNGGDDTNTGVGDDSQNSKELADDSYKEQDDNCSKELANDSSKDYSAIKQTDCIAKEQTDCSSKEQANDGSKEQTDDVSKQQTADNSKQQTDDVSKQQTDSVSKQQTADNSQQRTDDNSKQQTDDVSKQQTDNVSKQQTADNSQVQTNDNSKEQVDNSSNQSQSQSSDISEKTIEISRNGDLYSSISSRDKPNTDRTRESEELSEVIPIQNSENIVLKTVTCDTSCNIISDVKKTTEKGDNIENKENTEKDKTMHIKDDNTSLTMN